MVASEEFCIYCHQLLDSDNIQDYCPNGLQVEGASSIEKLATAVTGDLATLEKAAEAGVDALLVHHGIFWDCDPYPIRGVKRRKLQLLFENDISLFAYHLPLDAHRQYGNNWKVAFDLGWQNLEPFCIVKDVAIGVKATFPPITREAFCEQLEKYYQHQAYSALGGKEMVSSVALVSGGAHRHITDAIAEGVDCFVTGSFDEPVWHIAHEEGINFFALGHAATERIGPRILGDHLAQYFNLQHTFLEDPNPF